MDRASRAELMGIARTPRLVGFVLVIAGAVLLFLPWFGERWWWIGPLPTHTAAWLLICAGWTLFGYVIGRRTQYSMSRRSESGG